MPISAKKIQDSSLGGPNYPVSNSVLTSLSAPSFKISSRVVTSNATKKVTSKREATDVVHQLPYSAVRMPALLATQLSDSSLSIFAIIKMKPLMIYIHLVRLNWSEVT